MSTNRRDFCCYPEIYRKGFFQFSISLEDAEDIISDLQQAMEKAEMF